MLALIYFEATLTVVYRGGRDDCRHEHEVMDTKQQLSLPWRWLTQGPLTTTTSTTIEDDLAEPVIDEPGMEVRE